MSKKRGNGLGSIVKTKRGYVAKVQLSCEKIVQPDGKILYRPKTRQKTVKTKQDAEDAIKELRAEYEREQTHGLQITATLEDVYTAWIATREKVISTDTRNCYEAAFKQLKELHKMQFSKITIDHWQDVVDSVHLGAQSLRNLRSLIRQLYVYAIPRNLTNKKNTNTNFGDCLVLNYDKKLTKKPRVSIDPSGLSNIWALAQDGDQAAKEVLMLIYTGMRPMELLTLKVSQINFDKRYLVGGSKTEAGINRLIPIADCVFRFFEEKAFNSSVFLNSEYLFPRRSDRTRHVRLEWWTEVVFLPLIERAGIENPKVQCGTQTRHLITPHNCRHTFATMLKDVKAADTDKLRIIGHSSDEMLRSYQDTRLAELTAIVDQLPA